MVPGILAALFIVLIEMFVAGGILRIWSWYLIFGLLPLIGVVYLIGIIVRIIWKRHFTQVIWRNARELWQVIL